MSRESQGTVVQRALSCDFFITGGVSLFIRVETYGHCEVFEKKLLPHSFKPRYRTWFCYPRLAGISELSK